MLSNYNTGEYGVKVTFYISPSTTISNAWIDITFPPHFQVSTGTCDTTEHAGCSQSNTSSEKITLNGINLEAGVDTMVSVLNVGNPTIAGGYGPFAITTRYFQYGQIIDINSVFGSVGILGNKPSGIANFNVALTSESRNTVSAQGSTLSFTFELVEDMWKHDLFTITMDKNWIVTDAIQCRSNGYTGRYNHFNGTDTSDPHDLACTATEKTTTTTAQIVYIYGLATDIDLSLSSDYIFVDLHVSGIQNPPADFLSSSQHWSVETNRQQNRTPIQYAERQSGPITDPGDITQVTYLPTWGMDTVDIVTGMSMFMDVDFATSTNIPAGGKIVLVFTDDVSTLTWGASEGATGINCYFKNLLVNTDGTYATCAATSTSQIEITNLPDTSARTFSLRVLTTFTTSALANVSISSIKSYYPTTGEEIDATTQAEASFSMSGTSQNLTKFRVGIEGNAQTADDPPLVTASGSTSNDHYFKIWMTLNSGISSTTRTTVWCPINTNKVSDSEFYIPNDGNYSAITKFDSDKLTAATMFGPVDMDNTGTNLAAPTIANGTEGTLGTIQWTQNANTVNDPSSGYTWAVALKNSSIFIGAPQVASNPTTAYECRVEIVDTQTEPAFFPMRGVTQIIVADRELKSGTASTTPEACRDYYDGTVVKTTFQLDKTVIGVDSTNTEYYVDIAWTVGTSNLSKQLAGFNSGLPYGASYPSIIQTASTQSHTSTLVQRSSEEDAVRIGNIGGLAADTTWTVSYPVGENSNLEPGVISNWSSRITVFFYDTLDTRFRQVLYYSSVNPASGTAAEAANEMTTFRINNQDMINGASYTQINYDAQSAAGTASADGDVFQMTFPTGWQLSSSPLFYHNQLDMTDKRAYFSTSRLFKFPSITGVTSGGTGAGSNFPDAESKAGKVGPVLTRAAKIGDSAAEKTRYQFLGDGTDKCKLWKSVDWTTTGDTFFQFVEISPLTTYQRGPGGLDLTVSFTINTNLTIPAGGSIVLIIEDVWETFADLTTCSVTGVVNQSDTVAARCTANYLTFTIDQIGETEATEISITVARVNPPTTGNSANFIVSLISYDDFGNEIERHADSTFDNITTLTVQEVGASSHHVLSAIPNYSGQTRVDLSVQFKLAYDVPSGGILEISGPLTWNLSLGLIPDSCWSNIKYSSCEYTGSTIVMTLGEAYDKENSVDVYLDNAVNNGISGTASAGYKIDSRWGDTFLTIDGNVFSTEQKPVTLEILISTITPDENSAIAFEPKNAGEKANYTFAFKVNAALELNSKVIIQFPREYDPFLGSGEETFSNDPGVYYIPCECAALGASWCTISHWKVTVLGTNTLDASEDITVVIHDVINPLQGTTSEFRIAVTDSSGAYISYLENFGTVETQNPAGVLQIRSVSATDQYLFSTSSYTFAFYLPMVWQTESSLKLLFPKEYDLYYNDIANSYGCTTTYRDDANNTEQTTQQLWNAAGSCKMSEDNYVGLAGDGSQYVLEATDLITFNVDKVGTPEWAETRTANGVWDFDLTDTDAFDKYEYWSSQYEFFVYENEAQQVYALKTYNNLNAAYVGFNYRYNTLHVNAYDPKTRTNRIIVYAGSQTGDIPITTASSDHPLAAAKVVLEPRTNDRTPDSGYLSYSSPEDDFKMYQESLEINFRISADLATPKGLYYIDWKILETWQRGVVQLQYHPPARTLVEVVPATVSVHTLRVETLMGFMLTGTTSVPIAIHCDNSPNSDVTINLSLEGLATGIEITPRLLTFGPSDKVKYFTVAVASDFDVTFAFQSIRLELSGTDAIIYNINSPWSFAVIDSPITDIERNAGSITSWGMSACTRTTCTSNPSIDQLGVLYWAMTSRKYDGVLGSCPTLESLKTQVGSLIDNPISPYETQVIEEYNATETEPANDESWAEFQQRLYSAHLRNQWVGAISFHTLTNVQTINFNWLWADTPYQICGYYENVYGNSSEMSIFYFDTFANDAAQQWEIVFYGEVHDTHAQTIGDLVSFYQGVNPLRNRPDVVDYTVRRLQAAVITSHLKYTLYADRRSNDPETATLAQVDGLRYDNLVSDLAGVVTNGVQKLVNMPDDYVRVIPEWTTTPSILSNTATTITIQLQTNIAGESSCVALDGHGYSTTANHPSSEQVYLGLNNENQITPSGKIITDLSVNVSQLVITGLSEQKKYTVFCTAVDNYPLWPTHMEYNEITQIFNTPVTTGIDTDGSEDDWARQVQVLLGLWALIIFF